MIRITCSLMATLSLVLLVGCSSEGDRVARVAVEAADRQANQTLEITQLNRQIASTVDRMSQTAETTQQAIADVQAGWQAQQAGVISELGRLEDERRSMAATRIRDSVLAPVIASVGMLIVAALPLALALFLLTTRPSDASTEAAALGELLIHELAADRPRLLSPANNSRSDRPSESIPSLSNTPIDLDG